LRTAAASGGNVEKRNGVVAKNDGKSVKRIGNGGQWRGVKKRKSYLTISLWRNSAMPRRKPSIRSMWRINAAACSVKMAKEAGEKK
jgi:hypothetical protein